MAIGVEAAYESVELESVITLIPSLIPRDTTLYGQFMDHSQKVPVSNATAGGGVVRPSMRAPFRPQAGGPIFLGTGDNDSLGTGTSSYYQAFALSPVFYFGVTQVSHLAQVAMEGRKRGLFNLQAQEIKYSFESFLEGLESQLNGDATGTLVTIPSTATINNNTGSGNQTSSIIGTGGQAFQIQDQQVVQVYSSGLTLRGTATVSVTDPVADTIYFSTALPSGTTTTDLLVVSGASGAAGSAIAGLRYWHTFGNTGTLAGISKATFPGRLSTPTINLNGATLSTSIGARAIHNLALAVGLKNESIQNAKWYTGPDQARQIMDLTLNIQMVNALEAKGDVNPDIVSKLWNKQFCGRDLIVGMHALPGRLDLILFDQWHIGELVAPQLYDFGGGNTVMPAVDTSTGGYRTSTIFAYEGALNLINSAPRLAMYIQNGAILNP